MKIGFIGLGIMGAGMVGNLLKNRVDVVVHNRTPEKGEPLVARGAKWGEKPGDVAGDIVFTMLAHPDAVTSMALGENGFLSQMEPGTVWVDCSTVHPRFSKEMASEAAEGNIAFIDAPVTGTKPQAENAQLVFYAGGSADSIASCKPYFDMMGRKVIHVGEQGMGSSIKVVINSILAAAIAVFSESVALGRALGLSQEMLFETLIGGPVTAPFIANKRDKMTNGNYSAQFPLQWMYKDLLMMLEAAGDTGVSAPLATAARDVYQAAIHEGFGDMDFSAIYQHYNPAKLT